MCLFRGGEGCPVDSTWWGWFLQARCGARWLKLGHFLLPLIVKKLCFSWNWRIRIILSDVFHDDRWGLLKYCLSFMHSYFWVVKYGWNLYIYRAAVQTYCSNSSHSIDFTYIHPYFQSPGQTPSLLFSCCISSQQHVPCPGCGDQSTSSLDHSQNL